MSRPHTTFFSTDLRKWLADESPKTVRTIMETFGVRASPAAVIVLMAIPALPLPTGGVSHIVGAVAFLISLQLIAGVEVIWLPDSLKAKELSPKLLKLGLPLLISNLQRVEKHSRQRGVEFMERKLTLRLSGFILAVGILASFLAPPFTGLDTFPAIGVIITALGLVMLDVSFWLIGVFMIGLSIVFEVTIGTAVMLGLRRLVSESSWTVRGSVLGFLLLVVIVLVVRHRHSRGTIEQ